MPVRAHIARQTSSHEGGAALLTVLIALMIMTLLLFEFQYSTMVERKLAYNELDQLRAYYLAKSGARIGLLRVSLFARAQNDPTLQKMKKDLPLDSYLDMIWQIPLPPFPPATDALKKLPKKEQDAAEKVLKETNVADGSFSQVITSEAAKINLNYLQVPEELKGQDRVEFNPPKTLFAYVGKSLINLMEQFIADSKNPYEEYGNFRPEDIVFNIMDWVNPGSYSYAGGNKDSFYEQQSPPYKAKRNRLYTIDELRLVKGISPALFRKLRRYVTVYSYDGKININTASREILRALYPDFNEDDLKKIDEEKSRLGGSWANEKQFVDFVVNTLRRSGFKEIYADEKNYPFTTGSQSFLIESMGTIQKSNSSVQRTIRVAVALTSSSGGGDKPEYHPTALTQAACKMPGWFWNPNAGGKCQKNPSTTGACQYSPGTPFRKGDQFCCKVNQVGEICSTATESSKTVAKPDKVKILNWSET